MKTVSIEINTTVWKFSYLW